MTDVRETLGEPLQKGVTNTNIIWHCRYQKVSARFFTPFIPIRRQDNLRGRLQLGFGVSNVLEHVDYYGDQ